MIDGPVWLWCPGLRQFELPTEVMFGYVAALAVSSIGLFAIPALVGSIWSILDPHSASAMANPAPAPPVMYVVIPIASVLLCLLVSPFALFCTLPTFMIFCAIALVYRIEFWAYYVLSAVFMSFPIALVLSGDNFHLNPWGISSFGADGALGGIIFWWVAVKRGRVMHKDWRRSA